MNILIGFFCMDGPIFLKNSELKIGINRNSGCIDDAVDGFERVRLITQKKNVRRLLGHLVIGCCLLFIVPAFESLEQGRR